MAPCNAGISSMRTRRTWGGTSRRLVLWWKVTESGGPCPRYACVVYSMNHRPANSFGSIE